MDQILSSKTERRNNCETNPGLIDANTFTINKNMQHNFSHNTTSQIKSELDQMKMFSHAFQTLPFC